MKLVQTLLLSFGFFAAAADAQENSPVDVISGQLGALETSNFETAFSFASPQIQEQMRTPKRFGSMVEAQFPMMIAVKDVRYLDEIRGTGIAVQRVSFLDSEGRYFGSPMK